MLGGFKCTGRYTLTNDLQGESAVKLFASGCKKRNPPAALVSGAGRVLIALVSGVPYTLHLADLYQHFMRGVVPPADFNPLAARQHVSHGAYLPGFDVPVFVVL